MSSPNLPLFDVSVIVVNYNTAHLLSEMFAALYASRADLRLQVIVVDNASRDDSVSVLRRDHPEVHLIVNDKNVGFGRANNKALPFVEGRYVLLLNTDAFVSRDTLTQTVRYMDAHPHGGVLGVRLLGRDGVLQPSCRYTPSPLNGFLHRTGLKRFFPSVPMVDDMSWPHNAVRQCDWVPGCYYLIRREVVHQVGLFDPRYFLYFEEVDHCRAVQQAGWQIVFFPHTSVVHIGGESAKSDGAITAKGRQVSALQIESELLYFRKHGGASSALAAVGLSTVADVLLAIKALLRGRFSELGLLGQHARTLWTLVARTRLGARPTR